MLSRLIYKHNNEYLFSHSSFFPFISTTDTMTSSHPSPYHGQEEPLPQSPRQLAQALVLSVSAMMSLWARKATQAVSRKTTGKDSCERSNSGRSLASDRKTGRRPAKRLLSNISSKAMNLVTHGQKRKGMGDREDEEDGFGDGGVWQRAILMGDKCQPLNFSGVIYYDESGKQLDQIPLRSPRATPLPGYLTRNMDCEVRT